MEFTTKEFAAELNCSTRTLEGWRISRNGKSPVLPPDHYKDGRAVYTDEQLAVARARLNKSATDTKPDNSEIDSDNSSTDSEQPAPDEMTPEIIPLHVEEIQSEITAEIASVTLEQRAEKIRRLVIDTQRNIIEIGFELIEAKREIGHGGWSNWLKSNFVGWTDRTARNFMAIAERFGNRKSISDLNTTTLIYMLALPVGDEQDFIDEQIAKGKPVESQSARDVQKSVKAWKEQRKPETITDNTIENDTDNSPAENSGGDDSVVANGTAFNVGSNVREIVDVQDNFAGVQNLLAEIGALIWTVDSQFRVTVIEMLRAIRDNLKSKKIARDDEQ